MAHNPTPMVHKNEDDSILFLTGTYQALPLDEAWKQAPAMELDLGCGVGSFTVALAKKYPERRIFAADVMIGRLRKLAKRCAREHIENLTLLRTEARHLLTIAVADAFFDRVHLLCPDPWPKGRHRGHRLLSSDFTAQLHRVLKPTGIFHFSSDDEPYYEAVKRVLNGSGLFRECGADPDLADVHSDFELRWLGQQKPVRHIYFEKLPLPPHTIGH